MILKVPPMKIKLKQSLSSKLDPSLYRFKPRTITMHIKEQVQQLLNDLEKQGIIRRMGPKETSEVCAPAGFVPKKSKKLRFMIDFTSLNKYIARPVHSFPSSDKIQQAIRHDTRFIACVDFPSGYFQLWLDKESQGLTVFNTEFARYLFLRAPQGLSSSGDAFNANTDYFYSRLGKHLLKQVNDMYIQGTSMEDLDRKLRIAAKEAIEFGCTWSISKFFAARPSNIVSGFRVVLDPSGLNPPCIGPDPARVRQLSQIQPPTTVKGVRSFLGFVNYLGKFCPDYAMTTTKIRGLTSKGSKFHWTDLHQQEFDHIIENLTKLEHLQPYKQGNTLHAMTDASVSGLGFILFQKDEDGKASIIQVGSTCLKNAQIRWHPSELELLAIQYCLKKCHFYTAHSDHPVEILSDCSGLKDFQLQDITNIQNTRLLNIKANLQVYNYTIKHIKGSKNHLADVLSRRPVWLNTDHKIGPDEGLDLEDEDAFAMRVAVSMPHLLCDNPPLRQLEEIARKDKEYSLSHV